jgi:hypothetical protein
MEYSFPRYLLSKQTVDDRALNRSVIEALRANIPPQAINIIEVGAGMGNMMARLLLWGVITKAYYIHVDSMEENIRFAQDWIPEWAAKAGLMVDRPDYENQLRIYDNDKRDILIQFECEDVFDFISKDAVQADLLIAHAFLDLLPMPESMPKLLSLTDNLAWLTVNFDGVTSLEPTIDAVLDDQIERLYHESMDSRPTGGDSRAGRHMFSHLRQANAKVLAAGASDWVVHAVDGKYPDDEAYFLQFILHFFEESLSAHPNLDKQAFSDWLSKRRKQIEDGELVYIAHQMDFLAKV